MKVGHYVKGKERRWIWIIIAEAQNTMLEQNFENVVLSDPAHPL